ncbi:MAG: type II toxin-antitoxin system MqsR family toxin [Deltaproteobacteria bacterium]|nr:type II toxin-antitoxin system MqsR family toxin [Deltaproteobacteria bacterium]
MEKRTPHYPLVEIKKYVEMKGIDAFTLTARRNGFAMGITQAELVASIMALTRGVFYKSMTSYNDHTLWQDVYHAPLPNGVTAYVKVSSFDTGRPVIQFKEL